MYIRAVAEATVWRITSSGHGRVLTAARTLSNTSPKLKKEPARSPRVRDLDRQRKQSKPLPEVERTVQEWPVAMLEAAHKAGGLHVTAAQAVEILNAFLAIPTWQIVDQTGFQKLCDDHKIKVTTLTMLARILQSQNNPKYHFIWRRLYHAASSMKDEAATILLLDSAVKAGATRLEDLGAPRTHLEEMVKANNSVAIVLRAKIYEAEGHPSKALELYECVTILSPEGISSEDLDISSGEAWAAIARLKETNKDTIERKAALAEGALKHDDPWAYYLLADTFMPEQPQYPRFMLKAAASGIPDAAYKMGRHYLRKMKEEILSDSLLRQSAGSLDVVKSLFLRSAANNNRILATEWLSIAAASPQHEKILESKLYLGILLREIGEMDAGLAMLNGAADSPNLAKYAVPFFKQFWYDRERKFLTMDVDAITSGEVDLSGFAIEKGARSSKGNAGPESRSGGSQA